MGKKKMIENYQLLEVIGQIQDKYQIIKAKHVLQKKYYTLKKVKIKNDKNNKLYESFLNEATLLKNIKHPNICKSIKMMKTASSIYVVYDYCEGQNLLQWMQKGYKKTIAQKQSIIKQICLVVLQMRKYGIIHLFLNPECIFINQEGDVKITDFMYGSDMPDTQEQIQILNKVAKNDFTSPEVKKGTACFESDIYSFGKIIEFMDILTSKKGTLSTKQFNVKCDQYKSIVRNTTKKKSFERDNIESVYKNIFKKKAKIRKMQSMSMSKIGGKDSMISRNSQISTASVAGRSQFTRDLILKLMRKRNMVKMLVDIMKKIITYPFENSMNAVILGTLLLKKSTIIMNCLGKFMKYGKGFPGMQLNQRQRTKFFKCGDYFKLQPLIENEVKTQKKLFQSTLDCIFLQNINMLKDKKAVAELRKEQVDQTYFRDLMKICISEVGSDKLSPLLSTFYLLGQILEHGGIEIFFQKKVNLQPINIQEQPIFIKIYKETNAEEMMAYLQKFKGYQPT